MDGMEDHDAPSLGLWGRREERKGQKKKGREQRGGEGEELTHWTPEQVHPCSSGWWCLLAKGLSFG